MADKASSPVKRKRTSTKGERTRQAIHETLIELVNSRPIDDIKVSDICAPSGLAVGAFYFHFKSKDDALDQLATGVVAQVYDGALTVPRSDDLFSEIAGILSEFYRAACEQRDRVKAFFHIMNARRHPAVRAAWMARRAMLLERLVARIDEARQATKVDGFQSSNVTAHFLIGALERFYDDVFFLTIDRVLPSQAGNFDVFVRQQAQTWVQVIMAKPTNP